MSSVDSRLRVGILGATGAVGQRFVSLLTGHPQFAVAWLAASPRSVGRPYGGAGGAVRWSLGGDVPAYAAGLVVVACEPAAMPGAVAVFSALDADVAGDVEAAFRDAGVAGARGRRCDAVARRAPPPATSTARSAAASLPQSFPTRATSAWWPTCRWWCRPSTAATWSSCARRRRLRPAAASVRAHARARGDGGERARAYALFDTPLSPQS